MPYSCIKQIALNQAAEKCYIVHITLCKYAVCMRIKSDILVYPTLYKELRDIVTFCNKIVFIFILKLKLYSKITS